MILGCFDPELTPPVLTRLGDPMLTIFVVVVVFFLIWPTVDADDVGVIVMDGWAAADTLMGEDLAETALMFRASFPASVRVRLPPEEVRLELGDSSGSRVIPCASSSFMASGLAADGAEIHKEGCKRL